MTRRIGVGGLRHATVVVVTTALLLGAALSGATVGVVDADSPSVAVTDESGGSAVEAPAGETVTVTVGASASSVSAYQTNLTFDPDVVQVESVSGTEDFDDPVANVDNERGWVAFNQYRSSNVSDPQLATVTVELVGEAGDETSLAFVESDTKLSDDAAQERGIEEYDDLTVTVESESDGSDDDSDDSDSDDSDSDDSDSDDSDDSDDNDSDDGDNDSDNDDSDGGDDGSASGDSAGGDSSAEENDDPPEGPPRVASDTASLDDNASIETTFDGGSPTIERLRLLLDSAVSGDYVTTEYERLPSDLTDSRSDDADDIVTVLEFDAPDDSEDAPTQIVLTLNRSAVNASEGNAEDLRVERYDEATGQWETLNPTVDGSDDGTMTLTVAPSRLGWFVVSTENASQTDGAPGPANETNATSPANGTSNGTSSDSVGAGDASANDSDPADATNDSDPTDATNDSDPADATNDSDTTGSSSAEESGTTDSEIPGFGVTTVLAAGAALYGGLRFRRRDR